MPQALFVGGCSALAIAARVAAAVSRGGAAAIGTSGARSASDVEFCFGGAPHASPSLTATLQPSARRAARDHSVMRASVRRARQRESVGRHRLEHSRSVSNRNFWPPQLFAAIKVVARATLASQVSF